MFKTFVFVAAALVACQSSVIPEEAIDLKNARTGNSYFYFDKAAPLQEIPITNMNAAQLVADTSFSASLDTVIIIHGHSGSAFTTLNPLVKDSLFRNTQDKDVNVIVVDWSLFAGLSYANAVAAVPQIGRNLAEYIRTVLVPVAQFELSKVHFVGFGLGAHVAGVAGRFLNREVGKITALDPSGNLWAANTERLTRHDAVYVEVIHTDGFGVLANGLGEPLGHIDFFVNGLPALQPGCINNQCNHERAYQVFAASLTTGNLKGSLCTTMQQVTLNTCTGSQVDLGGMELVKAASGIYRINTRAAYPYTP